MSAFLSPIIYFYIVKIIICLHFLNWTKRNDVHAIFEVCKGPD